MPYRIYYRVFCLSEFFSSGKYGNKKEYMFENEILKEKFI